MKEEKMKVEAILFDLDGTIFDITERDAFARYQALREIGYNVSLEDVKQFYCYGIGRMGIVKSFGIKLSEQEAKRYIEKRFAHFAKRENAVNLTEIHDQAYDVISTLSKKYKLVLVTSRGLLSPTEEELEWFNLREFFTLIVTREVAAEYHGVEDIPLLPFQEQRKKLYECAIGLMGIAPENMLCIGDSIGELLPAKSMGIKTVGVLTGFSSKEEMEKASILTIQDLTQLKKMMK